MTTKMLATDASGGGPEKGGLGACEAEADPAFVGKLYRRAEGRGIYTKLSRAFGLDRGQTTPLRPPSSIDKHFIRFLVLSPHPRFEEDLGGWVCSLGGEQGAAVRLEHYQLRVGGQFDLANPSFVKWISERVASNKVDCIYIEPLALNHSGRVFTGNRTTGHPSGKKHRRSWEQVCRNHTSTECRVLRELEEAAVRGKATCGIWLPRLKEAKDVPKEYSSGGVRGNLSWAGKTNGHRGRLAYNLAASFLSQAGLSDGPLPVHTGPLPFCQSLTELERQQPEKGNVRCEEFEELQKLRLETEVGAELLKFDWAPVFSLHVQDERHINLDECKALRFGVIRDAECKNRRRRRKIYLVDSGVAVGAFAKGRSSSKKINREIRRLLPYLLGGRLYMQLIWIPSHANPSDPLSRHVSLRIWVSKMRAQVKAWMGRPHEWLMDLDEEEEDVTKKDKDGFRWAQKEFDSSAGFPGEGWKGITLRSQVWAAARYRVRTVELRIEEQRQEDHDAHLQQLSNEVWTKLRKEVDDTLQTERNSRRKVEEAALQDRLVGGALSEEDKEAFNVTQINEDAEWLWVCKTCGNMDPGKFQHASPAELGIGSKKRKVWRCEAKPEGWKCGAIICKDEGSSALVTSLPNGEKKVTVSAWPKMGTVVSVAVAVQQKERERPFARPPAPRGNPTRGGVAPLPRQPVWLPLIALFSCFGEVESGRMQLPRPAIVLKEQAVEAGAQQDYKKALSDFSEYLVVHDHATLNVMLEKEAFTTLDEASLGYLQQLWDDEYSYTQASYLLSGLHDKFPVLKAKKALAGSWRALKAWDRLEPSEFRKPWPLVLLMAVVVVSFMYGRAAHALAYWVLFHGVARPGEVAAKEKRVLVLPEQLRWLKKKLGILVVERPKTRGIFARVQHILLDERLLLRALSFYTLTLGESEMIFPSYASLEYWMKQVWVLFGLAEEGYTLGGLRAGGATHHYLSSFQIPVLQRRMRHKSGQTIEHYVQEAVAVLGQQKWAEETGRKVERYSRAMRSVVQKFLNGEIVQREKFRPKKKKPGNRARSAPARTYGMKQKLTSMGALLERSRPAAAKQKLLPLENVLRAARK